ncbi:hypothetical protein CYMTET_14942, partial [Cymbomonas tetramitiformis]
MRIEILAFFFSFFLSAKVHCRDIGISLGSREKFSPNAICDTAIDLMLVVDGSNSIDSTSWDEAVDFCSQLIDSFKVSYNESHVGLTQFSKFGRLEQSISYVKADIERSIDFLRNNQMRMGTCIGGGLEVGQGDLKANGRKGVPHLMILMTDGKNNVAPNPIRVADDIKDSGTEIFVIGVSSAVDPQELESIASSPTSKHMYYASDFADLKRLISEITHVTCDTYQCDVNAHTCSLLPPGSSGGMSRGECLRQCQAAPPPSLHPPCPSPPPPPSPSPPPPFDRSISTTPIPATPTIAIPPLLHLHLHCSPSPPPHHRHPHRLLHLHLPSPPQFPIPRHLHHRHPHPPISISTTPTIAVPTASLLHLHLHHLISTTSPAPPPPPSYLCNIETLQCVQSSASSPQSAARPPMPLMLCVNSVPAELQGVWRGVLINANFSVGEYDAEFTNTSLRVHAPGWPIDTFPVHTAADGSVQVVSSEGAMPVAYQANPNATPYIDDALRHT